MKQYGEIELELHCGVLGNRMVEFDYRYDECGKAEMTSAYLVLPQTYDSSEHNWVCIDDCIDQKVVDRVLQLVEMQWQENRNMEAEFAADLMKDEAMLAQVDNEFMQERE